MHQNKRFAIARYARLAPANPSVNSRILYREWKGFHPELYAFITPFCPSYAPKTYKDKHWKRGPVDYSHEREWRVPHDVSFELKRVEFVIVPDYAAVAKFPRHLKDEIGRDKFIMLEVYSQIEKLWPVHLM